MWELDLWFSSLMLGMGLAMDAFSVSLANGLCEPHMRLTRMLAIAGTFGFFQALMPLIGWYCVHTVLTYFVGLAKFVPWIALALLGYLGGRMLYNGLCYRPASVAQTERGVGVGGLLLQGLATSIDALSAGFQIASYDFLSALLCALLIAGVTFLLCTVGVKLGGRFGTRLSGRASILGGGILILIGLKIFFDGAIT